MLAAIGVAIGLTIRWFKDDRNRVKASFRPTGFVTGIVVFFAALVLIVAVGQVPAGTRGVVLRFGAVTERTLDEGIYIVTPFVNSVENMDVQTQKYEVAASAASNDLQDVESTVTLNYHLNPNRVNWVYQNLRRDYEERIIAPAIQESFKATTALYIAEDLVRRRPEAKRAVEDALRERLSEKGITLDIVSLTDFKFSEVFSTSIEAKQVAAQKALEAENLLLQIEVEARQVKAAAEGERDAAIEAAQGRKEAAILDAQGQAEAIRLVAIERAKANDKLSPTITDEIIRFNLVDNIADDVRVIVIPAGQEFIFGEALLGGPAGK